MDSKLLHYHVIVKGRVQGVSYRAWTRGQATELGLFGSVRNLEDGSVEAYLLGTQPNIDELLSRMNSGPFLAKVSEVVANPCDAFEANSFEIAR